jgi:FKBP-type peptidyl-prolyl cis-trans isomerase (trigger factor)
MLNQRILGNKNGQRRVCAVVFGSDYSQADETNNDVKVYY